MANTTKEYAHCKNYTGTTQHCAQCNATIPFGADMIEVNVMGYSSTYEEDYGPTWECKNVYYLCAEEFVPSQDSWGF